MQTTPSSEIITRRTRRVFQAVLPIIAALTLLLNGCTIKQPIPPPTYPKRQPLPSRPVPPPPRYPAQPQPLPKPPVPEEPVGTYIPKIGPAGALYASARKDIDQGNYQEAEMTLERALRIEPRNGHYWYAMAQAKYKQKKYAQAIQLCSKSKSLAGKNSTLIRLNDALIHRARQQLSN